MSFLNPPKTVDPATSSNAQLGYNKDAAQIQQQMNMVNQYNPFGSQVYAGDPNSPSGYSSNITLSPDQQAILNNWQKTQETAGGVAQNFGQAAQNISGAYGFGAAPNIDPSSLTNKMMGWGQQYMQPIFDQQQSNLDAKLQNQGINPGSPAYNNAQNLQSRNVNNAYQSLFLNAEPTAFTQALQEYQLPMQTAANLQSVAQGAPKPTAPNSLAVTTPQEQIGSPNYQQAAQNQFQAQQQQYTNMMGGIGQLAGVAAAPFTGGLSLMPGMFANSMMGGGSPSGYGGGWG